MYGGGIALDTDGTIAIAGIYHQQSTNNNQFHFTRVAADGKSGEPFQFAFGSGDNQDDHALGVAIDRQGRYLVSGYHRGAAGNYDCAVIRITRDLYDVDRTFNDIDPQDYGSLTLAFDYGGDNFDSCNTVAVQNDYIILGGNSTKPTTGGTFQAATLALLDPNGALIETDCVNICVPAKFAFAYSQSNAGAVNTIGKLIVDPYDTKFPNVYAVGSGRLGGSPHGQVFGIARLKLPQVALVPVRSDLSRRLADDGLLQYTAGQPRLADDDEHRHVRGFSKASSSLSVRRKLDPAATLR